MSSTALEEMHHLEPHIRVARARAGVIMFILSDAISVVAIMAAGGYLSELNVANQYRLPTDHPSAFFPGLLYAIALLVSGLAYYWWEQRVRKNQVAGQGTPFVLALIFMVVALVLQVWMGLTLGYSAPFHAYESLIMLLTWYSAVHLLLAAIIGILLVGRMRRGRLTGQEYIIEVTGYWWYYTVIAGVLMWLFSTILI